MDEHYNLVDFSPWSEKTKLMLKSASSYEDQVVLGIFRSLKPTSMLPAIYEDQQFNRAGDICASACRRSIEGLERYERELSLSDYSIMVLYPLLNSSLTLVNLLPLGDGDIESLFCRACRLLELAAADFPFTSFLLQALQAVAQQKGITIPSEATKYFSQFKVHTHPTSPGLHHQEEQPFRDVPISFILPEPGQSPQEWAIGDMESGHPPRQVRPSIQLGTLIEKWNSLSIGM
jgi:hypothetical protein